MVLESAALRFISEDCLLVEYGLSLDEATHQKVLSLDAALHEATVGAQLELLPSFRSLMIKFDPFIISHDEILETLSELELSDTQIKCDKWRVPVCFEDEYSEDLGEFAEQINLSQTTVVTRLLASPLKLYMYGFASGFAYLGGLDQSLSVPRRKTPRAPMPAGALIVAGGMAGLSSVSLPTGWYVLGQTPVTMFSAERNPMVPFSVGDELSLYEVTREDFLKIQAENQKSSDALVGLEHLR